MFHGGKPEINEHAPYNGLFHCAFYVAYIKAQQNFVSYVLCRTVEVSKLQRL